ncbi:MAG: serine/threonine protein phosphatase [Sphingobium sp.]|nr:MAG: serine/threonine protein phosphatase [Sphingobium sp.]
MGYFRIGRKAPKMTEGLRVYAVGDVHGCFKELAGLFQLIERDSLGREAKKTRIIFLGDMIDRGRQSADVCRLLYDLRDYDGVVCLKGNHEKAMCDSLNGDLSALRFWMDFGGAWTMLSWGVDPKLVQNAHRGERYQWDLLDAFRAAIPRPIAQWVSELPLSHREGDYFFAHAGIRPGVPLHAQTEDDLLWIREPFLSSWRRHEAVVVHGHSESDMVTFNSNRIGVDTACYRTGCLTALGLEGNQQWTISTTDAALVALETSERATA